MALRREIQDSDDEETDFSPVKLPDTTGTVPQTAQETLKTPSGKNSSSTDSSFFRGLYEKQLQGVLDVPSPDQQPVVGGISSGAEPGTSNRTENSSSITDPVMGKQKRLAPNSGELIDLTEVTTPAEPESASGPDAWDVPSSAEVRIRGGGTSRDNARHTPNSSSKTYGKRKHSQPSGPSDFAANSLPDTSSDPSNGFQDPAIAWPLSADGIEDASPMPAQKKRRKTATQQSSDEDHLANGPSVAPRSDEEARTTLGDGNVSSDHATSIVYDTVLGETQGILEVSISQNHMTSSQRGQYQAVGSLEDEHAPPAAQKPLSSSDLPSEQNHKSSGTDTVSTVPFGTPSQFRVYEHEQPDVHPTSSSKRHRFIPGEDHLLSSPDIIAGPTPGPMRRTAANQKAMEDSWGSDEIGHHRESYNPRLSKRRSTGGVSQTNYDDGGLQPLQSSGADELGDTEPKGQLKGGGNGTDPIWIQSSGHEQQDHPLPEKELPKPQKKRGRKKKESGNAPAVTASPGQNSLGNSTTADPSIGQSEKPKKKRGRPKKSEAAKAAAILDASASIQEAADNLSALADATDCVNEEVEGEDEARDKNWASSSRDWSQAGKIKSISEETEVTPSPAAKSRVLDAKSGNTASPVKPSLTPTMSTQKSNHQLGLGKENQLQDEKLGKSNAAKENDKEVTKPGPASSQSGKVQYRVGLSKKSRIAPLLKSLRK